MTQALPLLITLIFLVYTFKFAILAELNPGSITTLFSLNTIYVGILFYFSFNEELSRFKILGMGLMVIAAVILAQNESSEGEANSDVALTVHQKRDYAILAVIMAFCGPFFWSFRSFHAKKSMLK